MTDSRREQLAANLARVRARIAEYAQVAGREPSEITLLPVTKFHPSTDLELLHGLGIPAVGENREQEARQKAQDCPHLEIHMIGQIQTKKANAVTRWAAAVHSVDSVRLAHGLERGMALALSRGDRDSLGRTHRTNLDCYVQVSADGDTARGGVTFAELPEVIEAVEEAEHLRFRGLMTVPPLGADARLVFEQVAARLRDLEGELGRPLDYSAGMSADMAEAIAAGSTMVRVGTEIMGPRPLG